MNENNLLSLVIFAPLAGAVINWLIGGKLRNELFSGVVACAAIFVSCAVALYIAFVAGGGAMFAAQPTFDHLWTWVQAGDFRADFGLAMDHLSAIYASFITFVGLLIHIFATGYMKGDSGFYRFFAYLNLFMFSMLTLILADNILLMFVGWEGVGLCSYLLIGYYFTKDEARRAAKKAFVMNRIGDWGVLIGIFLIFTLTGSMSFYDKTVDGVHVASALNVIAQMSADPFSWQSIFAGGITSAAVLLFIGATGKSAQIPLFTWLPDAMAGPTPVSALIHAATMVTAGVYMVVRCNAIYQNAPTAMFIVALIGCGTAIFAASIGLAQNDIKKVLAYSTVSQLGYMFLACGVGAFISAIFHVMTHAFFKALLFLGSGSVITGMHHEQDMRKMGNLRKYMPITYITMGTAWLAICGIPIWAGFFSKDEILYRTFSASGLPEGWNYVLWIVGLITAVLTAVYMTRLMAMTFFGEERYHNKIEGQHASADDEEHHPLPADFKPHESHWLMTAPLIVLAVLSTIGGLVGVPYAMSSMFGAKDMNVFERVLEPVIAKVGPNAGHEAPAAGGEHNAAAAASEVHHSAEEVSAERKLAVLSVILAVAGIVAGWLLFAKTPLRKLPKILEDKWRVDELYNGYFVDPLTTLSREGLWKGFDVGFIDGIVNGIGHFAVELGNAVRSVQVGYIRSYAAVIVFGAVVVVGYFIYYGLKLVG
ncbi:MAG: NADH-quinone oxidoreductase subunit L [Chloracidobacterium sp.]|nr:NADH-quinone oxidoreductase subunit L [Chloracidobacterium sp.]